MAKLGDVFNLQMGKTPSRNKSSYWNNGEYNWVSISDLSNYQKYVESTKEKISLLAVQESGIKSVPANTVIMSFKLSLGKTAITQESIYTNEAIMAFIPTGKYDVLPDYFYYLFSAKDWSKGTNRAVMGTTLNKALLSEIDVPIPPIDEQRRIAAVLDKVSDLIAKRRQQLDKLDLLIKSRFIEMFGDISKNTERWKTSPLDSLCDGIGDGLHGTPEYTENGEYSFINGNNLIDGSIVITSATKKVNRQVYEENFINISKNALLVSINGTLGKLAMYNGEKIILGKSACYCNLKSNMNRMFVYWLMKSDAFLKYLENNATKSTIKNVGLKVIRNYPMILPPIEHQNKFVAFVNTTDKLKFEVQKSLKKLKTFKKSLMQQYFG